MTADRERLFFALWPPAVWQDACHTAVRRRLKQTQGRWIPAAKLHITLVFLGALTRRQRECVETGADDIDVEGFTLDFTRLIFQPRNRMVWALPSATPPALLALSAQLRDAQSACGLEVEHRPFLAHLTLLRSASRIEPCPLEGVEPWQVSAFALVRSQTLPSGAVYEIVREWPLTGGGKPL